MISAINPTQRSSSVVRVKPSNQISFQAMPSQKINTIQKNNKSNVNFTGWKFIGITAGVGALGIGGAVLANSYGLTGGLIGWSALIGGVAAFMSAGGLLMKIFRNT